MTTAITKNKSVKASIKAKASKKANETIQVLSEASREKIFNKILIVLVNEGASLHDAVAMLIRVLMLVLESSGTSQDSFSELLDEVKKDYKTLLDKKEGL